MIMEEETSLKRRERIRRFSGIFMTINGVLMFGMLIGWPVIVFTPSLFSSETEGNGLIFLIIVNAIISVVFILLGLDLYLFRRTYKNPAFWFRKINKISDLIIVIAYIIGSNIFFILLLPFNFFHSMMVVGVFMRKGRFRDSITRYVISLVIVTLVICSILVGLWGMLSEIAWEVVLIFLVFSISLVMTSVISLIGLISSWKMIEPGKRPRPAGAFIWYLRG